MDKQKIAIHGVPRSGTSWLGAIFDSNEYVAYRHQPLFSYAFKSFLSEDSSYDEIQRFFSGIAETKDDFVLQKEGKEKGIIPHFKKKPCTHIVYKEARYHHILTNLLQKDPKIKVVGIIRNPKSVISSWYLAPKEFKKDWSLLSEWMHAHQKNQERREEFYGYFKWKEFALKLLKLKKNYPDRLYIVNYSHLLYDMERTVIEMFEFCNLNYTLQTNDFIIESQSIDKSFDAYAVFRKDQRDDRWKTTLPNKIVSMIDEDLRGTPLVKFNK